MMAQEDNNMEMLVLNKKNGMGEGALVSPHTPFGWLKRMQAMQPIEFQPVKWKISAKRKAS